jgi:hypothetical protein
MTRKEFAKLFFSLGLQLRAPVGEPELRAYYAVLGSEPESLVAAAAERFMREATWFPKTSEWMAAIRAVEADRRQAQREASRREGALCAVCEDTGWAASDVDGVRVVNRCACWTARRAERLGVAAPPPPALPPIPNEPNPEQLARIKAAVLPFVKGNDDERLRHQASARPGTTDSGAASASDSPDGDRLHGD